MIRIFLLFMILTLKKVNELENRLVRIAGSLKCHRLGAELENPDELEAEIENHLGEYYR